VIPALNEPSLAESIGTDILEIGPEQQASIDFVAVGTNGSVWNWKRMCRRRERFSQSKGDYEARILCGNYSESNGHTYLRHGGHNTLRAAVSACAKEMELNYEARSFTRARQ